MGYLSLSFAPPKEPSRKISIVFRSKSDPASSTKSNEPKKKSPEMITSTHPYARYTSHVGAKGWVEVRSISGLPTRLKHRAFS